MGCQSASGQPSALYGEWCLRDLMFGLGLHGQCCRGGGVVPMRKRLCPWTPGPKSLCLWLGDLPILCDMLYVLSHAQEVVLGAYFKLKVDLGSHIL